MVYLATINYVSYILKNLFYFRKIISIIVSLTWPFYRYIIFISLKFDYTCIIFKIWIFCWLYLVIFRFFSVWIHFSFSYLIVFLSDGFKWNAGYIVGMCFAFIAIFIMNKGQPALLYLVPCTLGPLLLLAWCRGHLRPLWKAYVPNDKMLAMACSLFSQFFIGILNILYMNYCLSSK